MTKNFVTRLKRGFSETPSRRLSKSRTKDKLRSSAEILPGDAAVSSGISARDTKTLLHMKRLIDDEAVKRPKIIKWYALSGDLLQFSKLERDAFTGPEAEKKIRKTQGSRKGEDVCELTCNNATMTCDQDRECPMGAFMTIDQPVNLNRMERPSANEETSAWVTETSNPRKKLIEAFLPRSNDDSISRTEQNSTSHLRGTSTDKVLRTITDSQSAVLPSRLPIELANAKLLMYNRGNATTAQKADCISILSEKVRKYQGLIGSRSHEQLTSPQSPLAKTVSRRIQPQSMRIARHHTLTAEYSSA